MIKKRILVVAAHPDDEIIGCGGTIARLTKEDHEVYTLILGEGITSRDKKRDIQKRKQDLDLLKDQAKKANSLIGVKNIFFFDFPDNLFDSLSLLEFIKVVEQIKNKIQPDIIFTHYHHDLNIDHQVTYSAVITATRPVPTEPVKEIYSFKVFSSTEWGYPTDFSPDVFFDITKTFSTKLKAMNAYKSELRSFPHPRSLEGLTIDAQYWGISAGVKYAEAFKLVRLMK